VDFAGIDDLIVVAVVHPDRRSSSALN